MCGPAVAVKRFELVNLRLVNRCGREEDLSPADHKKHFIYIFLDLAFVLSFYNLYVQWDPK